MKLVSLKCMKCSEEMAKVSVPEVINTIGERKQSSGIICIPCAEKARQIKLETIVKKVAVFL